MLFDARRVAFDEAAVDLHLAPVGVHRHVDHFGLRHLDALGRAAVAFGLDGSIV